MNGSRMHNQPVFKTKYLIAIVIGCALLFLVCAVLSWPSRDELAKLGDAFGVFNAFFSALAFIGLGFTLYVQHKQLRVQLEELKQSEQAQKETAEALRAQLKIEALSSRLNATVILMQAETLHISEAHQWPQVEFTEVGALENALERRERVPVEQRNEKDKCLIRNLKKLISMRRDTEAIYAELQKLG